MKEVRLFGVFFSVYIFESSLTITFERTKRFAVKLRNISHTTIVFDIGPLPLQKEKAGDCEVKILKKY